jgi:hypothetical protein
VPLSQVATALKLSEEDQATIAALKREIEKSWRMVDASHEKARATGRAWEDRAGMGSICRQRRQGCGSRC